MYGMEKMTDEQLRDAQIHGAATYCMAYLHRMTRAIQEPVNDDGDLGAMVLEMVPALNHATQAMWCALMHDLSGMHTALTKFKFDLEHIS